VLLSSYVGIQNGGPHTSVRLSRPPIIKSEVSPIHGFVCVLFMVPLQAYREPERLD
jgi:hypothetical protein